MSQDRSVDCDVAVVGSGISGSFAAHELIRLGLKVILLDVGFDDRGLRDQIPDEPFSELRRSDPNQRLYFLGPNLEGIPPRGVKVGAQLTPPRQHIQRDADALMPMEGDSFRPLQSVCIGGLGAGWGAACFTFSDTELREAGIWDEGFPALYQEAADLVGISADPASEVNTHLWRDIRGHQPALEIDSNAESILHTYDACREVLRSRGFWLGRIPLAILSEDMPPRRANPYFDMDFYSDSRQSIFRPRYLIEQLHSFPRFEYRRERLVIRFESTPACVRVHARNLATNTPETCTARRVLLCAGAINTARIVLNSLGLAGVRTTLLCNPYTYFPSVNLRMLGREARDRRHSMAQIGGVLECPDGSGRVRGAFQMYSYRSLLLFKLVKEMPLPPSQGLLVARCLLNSLAIFGIFFADAQSEAKCLALRETSEASSPVLRASYELSVQEKADKQEAEQRLAAAMRRLRCIPIGRVDPGNAGSIHYAGTIPFHNPLTPRFHCHPDSTIEGAPGVYVGDSASWNFLPAKGLSFTLMANAIRVARMAAGSL
jgi:hypothetical protein